MYRDDRDGDRKDRKDRDRDDRKDRDGDDRKDRKDRDGDREGETRRRFIAGDRTDIDPPDDLDDTPDPKPATTFVGDL